MMKYKTHILAVALLGITATQAQNIKVPVGKKFQVEITTALKTKTDVMGQSMEVSNSVTNVTAFEIKAVTEKGYTLGNTLKRIKMVVGMMGMDQTVDTDDAASKDNPQFAETFKALNKTYDVEVEGKKVTSKGEMSDAASQVGAVPGVGDDPAKMILPKDDMAKLKEGSQWKDSANTEEAQTLFEYTVIKVTPAITEIAVKATIKVETTVKQGGMDVKQSLKGTSKAQRQYDSATGLLIREDADVAISGKMDIMGQSAPLEMNGKVTTIVK